MKSSPSFSPFGGTAGGGDFGKLESGASGCLMSYRNSGMIGTVRKKRITNLSYKIILF